MKIAVIASGPTMEYSVAKWMQQDGYLLIIDPETMAYEAMQNPVTAARGPAAGKFFAQILRQNNVWAIMIENTEFKILKELADADIQIFVGMKGAIRELWRSSDIHIAL